MSLSVITQGARLAMPAIRAVSKTEIAKQILMKLGRVVSTGATAAELAKEVYDILPKDGKIAQELNFPQHLGGLRDTMTEVVDRIKTTGHKISDSIESFDQEAIMQCYHENVFPLITTGAKCVEKNLDLHSCMPFLEENIDCLKEGFSWEK